MSWWNQRNKRKSPWGQIKSPEEINALNRRIREHEKREFEAFEAHFDDELNELFGRGQEDDGQPGNENQQKKNKCKDRKSKKSTGH